MIVTIDKNAGFCFGVTKAITIVRDYLTKNESLYCLGELVHNEEEMERLEAMGLKILNYTDLSNIHDKDVLFRAHGEPIVNYRKIESQGNHIIDATCPIVKELQRKVIQSYKNQERIFIYGKLLHPEIQGIIGNINNDAVVFTSIDELSYLGKGDSITLYSQTTMSQDDYNAIIEELQGRGVNVNAINSVCVSVRKRKADLLVFCQQHDVILFVAGKNSSNGKSLFSACKDINPNSYFISSIDDIEKEWFKDCNTIGISGATSTPLDLLERVKNHIMYDI